MTDKEKISILAKRVKDLASELAEVNGKLRISEKYNDVNIKTSTSYLDKNVILIQALKTILRLECSSCGKIARQALKEIG